MKILNFLAIAAIAIMMASCGDNKGSVTHQVESELEALRSDETMPYSGEDTVSSIYNESSDDASYESSDSYTPSNTSNSEDWDALLNSYEQYVDQYISYMKKVSKGDMNALAEYPALMQKAQEYCNKMEGAKGDMSTSQWARYLRITNKMTQAAADMQ